MEIKKSITSFFKTVRTVLYIVMAVRIVIALYIRVHSDVTEYE